MKNRVNVKWQMIATLCFVSGLWAFKRINKLAYGILTYIGCYALYIGSTQATSILIYSAWSEIYKLSLGIAILSSLVITLIIPMIVIRKYSIEYNLSISKFNLDNKTGNSSTKHDNNG